MLAASRRRWSRVVVALVAVLSVVACSAESRTSPPVTTVTPTATPSSTRTGRPVQPVPDVRTAGLANPPPGSGQQRYRQQRLDWKPCTGDLQCATVLAPLDHDDPDGEALTLALAKRPATGPGRLGTLFVNPGGPGGSGRGYVTAFRDDLPRYDIVGWDPRGVGQSTPVRCFGSADLDRYLSVDTSPDTPAEESALVAETYAFDSSCLAASGTLLQHISTQATVQDLDLLRELVGDQRLSYLGASYGTKIGALYAQLYPSRVGHLVLDGAVDISGSKVSQLEGFERALDHFAAWAATDPEQGHPLGRTGPAVLDRVAALLHGLDAQPMAVRGGRALSQQQGVQAVQSSLYERGDWPVLLRSLVGATQGTARDLLALADGGNYRSPDGRYGQINYAFPAIRCLDSRESSVAAARRSAVREAAKAPVLGPLSGPDLVCPLWPVAPAPKEPRIVGRGAPPVLVLGTTGDPATPYEDAVGMAHQLASGVLVTLEGEGHTAYGQSRCVQDLVNAYLVDDRVPADGTRCSS